MSPEDEGADAPKEGRRIGDVAAGAPYPANLNPEFREMQRFVTLRQAGSRDSSDAQSDPWGTRQRRRRRRRGPGPWPAPMIARPVRFGRSKADAPLPP